MLTESGQITCARHQTWDFHAKCRLRWGITSHSTHGCGFLNAAGGSAVTCLSATVPATKRTWVKREQSERLASRVSASGEFVKSFADLLSTLCMKIFKHRHTYSGRGGVFTVNRPFLIKSEPFPFFGSIPLRGPPYRSRPQQPRQQHFEITQTEKLHEWDSIKRSFPDFRLIL